MVGKRIVILIAIFILLLFGSSGKVEPKNKEEGILILRTSSRNSYYLLVHGEPAIKIYVMNKEGKEINLKEWNRTGRGFDPESNYFEIVFKITKGWNFSGLRIRQSNDEESILKRDILLTLRDIQKYATFYKRDRKSFHILTNTDCHMRIRVLAQEKITIEKTFILEFVPSEKLLSLSEIAEDFLEPSDLILDDTDLRRVP